jgi:hypothetical protein
VARLPRSRRQPVLPGDPLIYACRPQSPRRGRCARFGIRRVMDRYAAEPTPVEPRSADLVNLMWIRVLQPASDCTHPAPAAHPPATPSPGTNLTPNQTARSTPPATHPRRRTSGYAWRQPSADGPHEDTDRRLGARCEIICDSVCVRRPGVIRPPRTLTPLTPARPLLRLCYGPVRMLLRPFRTFRLRRIITLNSAI